MIEIFISIGSNLGNRRKNIEEAIKKMSEHIHIVQISRLCKTMPQENVQGGWFLNGVLYGKTALTPLQLLKFLQSIEEKLGRPINHKKNTERTIDLDILFYNGKIIKKKLLTIPHPKILKRKFVLRGLREIKREFVHPETGKTIDDLWREYGDTNNKKTGPRICGEDKT